MDALELFTKWREARRSRKSTVGCASHSGREANAKVLGIQGLLAAEFLLRFVPASSTTWRFGKGLFGRQWFWNFVCCSVVVLLQSWWLRSFGFWLCFLRDHVSAHCQYLGAVSKLCAGIQLQLMIYTVVPAFLHRRCLKAQFFPISFRDVYHLRSAMWRGGYAEVDIIGTSMSEPNTIHICCIYFLATS